MKRFAHFWHQPCMPLGKDGRLATGSPEHIALSLEAACEGMVLLKNKDNVLPLKKDTKVAIFGTAQFDYVRGGGGSGDVTTAYTRNIYEGFKMKEEAGLIKVYEPVSALFGESVKKQKEEKGAGARCDQPDIPDSLLEDAIKNVDVAILTICRYSWEGGDRTGTPLDGDYYLNESELKLKDLLLEKFSKVVVVLDVGAVVDTSWFKDEDKVSSVLMAWQAGIEGGLAIADTVCGLSNPSGRLVDTFPDTFDAFPSSEHFHDSIEYVDYFEDIYVGYRYFETFPEQKVHVNYPFGYGLSYTDFEVECKSFTIGTEGSTGVKAVVTEREGKNTEADFGVIKVVASVKNTGTVAGKNAVGLYYGAPNGKLLKPAMELGAFGKSKLLQPGESDEIVLLLPIADMASFDDLGKVSKSAYILEAGKYKFFLGADVSKAKELPQNYEMAETKVVKQFTSLCAPHKLTKRLLGDGTYEELATDDTPVTPISTCYKGWTVPAGRTIIGRLTPEMWDEEGTKVIINEETGAPVMDPQGHKNSMPDFMKVANGEETLDEFVSKLPVEILIEMLGGQPNTGVANTFGMGNVDELKIPNVMTADGPAGLRVDGGLGVTTTAWPIATMLACTWNTELVERVGAAGGLEVRENHIGLWLTPAMNIHRTPLCGRNFEYYSEDPFMTGKMGAAMIRGIQSQKVGTSMKHFACNNKEVDRRISDSRLSERALREIYLKGFEIAVKEAGPWTIMTSYNIVNGVYSSQNKDLLTGILRNEWGFDGMVTTDWMNHSSQVPEVKAGNDLKMPIGEPKVLLEAYNNGELSREDIAACATRILKTILRFD